MSYAFEELRFLGQKLGLARLEVQKCLEKAARNPDNIPLYKSHFLKLLQKENYSLSNLPLFSLNVPQHMPENGIFIGNIIRGNSNMQKLFVPVQAFQRHSLIVGMTGSGKSTLVKSLIPQFIKKGIGVWAFDHENEYKCLLHTIPPEKFLVLDQANDKDNFLEPPPFVSKERWRSVLLAILREQWLRDGSLNLVGDVLLQLYARKGERAKVLDVFNQLKAMQFKPGTRYAGYHESALNRIGGLLDDLGSALLCEKGYSLTDLIDKCVVYNISTLSDMRRHFYITLKMLRVMTYLESRPSQGLRMIFVIDEAHKFYNKETARNRNDLGEPMMFANARTFAKRGIGCFYLDQVPSQLTPALRGNVNNIFCARLTNGECVKWSRSAMNLDAEQAQQIPLIEDRHFLFLSGEFPDVLLIQIPEISFEHVSDEAARLNSEKVLAQMEFVAVSDMEEQTSLAGATLPTEALRPSARPNRLWTEIAKLVAEVGWISLTDLAANLGNVAPWHLRKTLSVMAKQDLIELCPISFGTRGNPKTFVVLKAKGAEFISLKFDDVRLPGKGSTEHIILQNLLAEAMKDAGKAVAIEHSAHGKLVDIAELREDGATAYEIELAPSHPHIAENALADLEAGFDEVVIITRNQSAQNEAKDRIYKTIAWEKLQRIRFKLLREFL